MKLYQSLERLFARRISSNEGISRALRELAMLGKFTAGTPQFNEVVIELCNRIVVLEDHVDLLEEYIRAHAPSDPVTSEPPSTALIPDTTEKERSSELSWVDLRKKATEIGVFKNNLTREQLEAAIAQKS